MNNIFDSAAKIVFVLVAITACATFFLGKLEVKDFMLLATMVFGFYFATPSNGNGGAGIAGSK